MDRTQRLVRRNAKKDSPRAVRLANFRDMRARGLRDHMFSKYHKDSYIHYIYKSLNIIMGYTLTAPTWPKDTKFPKENRFKYNGEEWWITHHGFIAKDDGLVKGWVDEYGTVQWIKVVPDKRKCFVWV